MIFIVLIFLLFSSYIKKLNKFLNKLLPFCSIIIVLGIITYLTWPFWENYPVTCEALYTPYLSNWFIIPDNSIFQVFTSCDHFWFIHSIVFVLTNRYLPLILNIHPQECITIVAKVFIFPLFLLLLFSLTESFYKYFKKKYIYAAVLLFIFVITVYLLNKSWLMFIFGHDAWFYAYIFLPVFAIVLYDNVEKYYVENITLNRYQYTILIALTLCVSISHEFFRCIFIAALFIGYIAHQIVFREKKTKIQYFKHIGIYSIICFINLLPFLTNYKWWIFNHVPKRSYAEFLSYMPRFINAYINVMIKDNLYFYILLFIGCILILIFIKNKIKNIKFFICILSNIIGLFIFLFSLIIVEESYENCNFIVLYHPGINFLISLLLFNLTLSTYGYLISNTSLNNNRIFINVFCIILLSFAVIFFMHNKIQDKIHHCLSNIKGSKQLLYIWEKSFLLLNKNKKFDDDKIYVYRILVDSGYIYLDKPYTTLFLTKINNINVPEEKVCYIDIKTNKPYYNIIYIKDSSYWNPQYIPELLNNIYKHLGYKFTKEELENLDFNSLYSTYK